MNNISVCVAYASNSYQNEYISSQQNGTVHKPLERTTCIVAKLQQIFINNRSFHKTMRNREQDPLLLSDIRARVRVIRSFYYSKVLSEERLKRKVGSPRSGARKMGQLQGEIEQRLNQMWFQLYKTMADIQAKRLGVASPRTLHEREALAAYARRKSQDLGAAGPTGEDFEEEERKLIESAAKKAEAELEKVVFLEQTKPQLRGKNVYHDKEECILSKYRQWVLEACGIKDDRDTMCSPHSSSKGRSPRSPRRGTGFGHRSSIPAGKDFAAAVAMGSLSPSSQAQRLQHLRAFSLDVTRILPNNTQRSPETVPAGRRFFCQQQPQRPHKHQKQKPAADAEKAKKTSKRCSRRQRLRETMAEFSSPEKLAGTTLFRGSVLISDSERNSPRPEIRFDSPPPVTPLRRRRVQQDSPAECTPLTAHARSIATLSPARLSEFQSDDRRLREAMSEFTRHIYGNRRRKGGFEQPIGPQIRVRLRRGSKKVPVISEPGSALLTSPARQPERIKNSFMTGVDLSASSFQRKFSLSNSNLKAGESRRSVSTAADSSLQTMLSKCMEERKRAEEDLDKVAVAGRSIGGELQRIDGLALGEEELQSRRDDEQYTKIIKKCKHLFIYGRGGQGRYLSDECKDMVRISDQIVKLDPKYPFMQSRLGDLVKNGL